MDVEIQNLKKGDFIDMDKTTKPSKDGIKTKHITSIKNALNLINIKAKPSSTVLKENDRLLSYKDKKIYNSIPSKPKRVKRKNK
jgi:hypothetical protein